MCCEFSKGLISFNLIGAVVTKLCGDLGFGTSDEKNNCDGNNSSKNSSPRPNNPFRERLFKISDSSGEFVKDHSFQEEDKMANKEERSNSHKHTKRKN